MNTDRVTVLSKAEIVDSPTPVRPNYKMNILLAFGAALMTGIALAFFWTLSMIRLQDRLKSKRKRDSFIWEVLSK